MISLIAQTAKIVVKVLRRRIERKIEDVPAEDQSGFRKRTTHVIGILKIISEHSLDIDEELCAHFIDQQKASDHGN
jgi:hypothetical protein